VYTSNRDEDMGEHGPIYRAIERALWVLGPVLILFLVLTYPSMQAARQQAATQMDVAIATENAQYCAKWGMLIGSAEHASCIRDLVGIQARSEQRVRDEAVSDF
jgi:hypothetical protein